jgi:hypothetical protein
MYHPIGNIEGQFPENVRPRPVLLEDLELDDLDNVYVKAGNNKYNKNRGVTRRTTTANSRINYLPVAYHLHDKTKTTGGGFINNSKTKSKSTDRINSGTASLTSV